MTTTFPPIPPHLLPHDGRFGSGPTKIHPTVWAAVNALANTTLGTSHRRTPVKNLVRQLQHNIKELYQLPADFQVLLGNGGATTFWDAALFRLIRHRSAHLTCGAFSQRFANTVQATPHLDSPLITDVPAGQAGQLTPHTDIDTYCWPHHETSTGVVLPTNTIPNAAPNSITVVDGTSAAGALPLAAPEIDVYYFSLQKGFGADGGLWVAWVSPKAQDRIKQLNTTDRWAPTTLNLATALDHSARHQTLNTPSVVTIALATAHLDWVLNNGGLPWAHNRCLESSTHLYHWAQHHEYLTPFVPNPHDRSPVVATLELSDQLTNTDLITQLAAHGIVDIDPYPTIGCNQLRIGMFPAIDPLDVQALTACIDWVIDHTLTS